MLVSAIMPTRGRPQYAREALDCFLRQTHRDRELIIVDDADDPSFEEPLIADFRIQGNIHYHRLNRRLTVGAKRNLACSRASGEAICHWDDDDFSAPERIEDQLTRLNDKGVGLTGYNRMRFFDVETGEWWVFNGGSHQVIGTSMMYTREFWKTHPFPDINEGEDSAVANIASRVAVVEAGEMMWARTHAGNTSKRDLRDREWVRVA